MPYAFFTAKPFIKRYDKKIHDKIVMDNGLFRKDTMFSTLFYRFFNVFSTDWKDNFYRATFVSGFLDRNK